MGIFKKKTSAAAARGRPAAALVEGSSESDISMMTDDQDWEAERAALRANLAAASSGPTAAAPAVDPFEHASLWAEVCEA